MIRLCKLDILIWMIDKNQGYILYLTQNFYKLS